MKKIWPNDGDVFIWKNQKQNVAYCIEKWNHQVYDNKCFDFDIEETI